MCLPAYLFFTYMSFKQYYNKQVKFFQIATKFKYICCGSQFVRRYVDSTYVQLDRT